MQINQIQDAPKNHAKVTTNDNIIPLKSSDFTIASEILAKAFTQDPLISELLPEDTTKKHKALKHLSGAFLRIAMNYDHVYTTVNEVKGVAMWLPPEAFKFSLSQLWQVLTSGLLIAPFYLRWNRIKDFISFLVMDMKFHEQFCPEPHLYLGMIGVSPTFQGEGIGRKLLEPVLKKADRTNMPCYLETTTTGAVRFYERLGFEVVHQDTFLDHQYWLMKRYPQNG